MHLSSSNIKIRPYSDANDDLDKLFKSLRSRYQENLEISMKNSDLIFNLVQLIKSSIYYKCHKVIFISGGSYINSPA